MKNKSDQSAVTKKAFSVAEAALALSISERTVHRLIRDRKIQHAKVGGRVLIPVDGIDAYLTSVTVASFDGAKLARDILK